MDCLYTGYTDDEGFQLFQGSVGQVPFSEDYGIVTYHEKSGDWIVNFGSWDLPLKQAVEWYEF